MKKDLTGKKDYTKDGIGLYEEELLHRKKTELYKKRTIRERLN